MRINFYPDAARGIDVVAAGFAHGGGGVAEEEEEHTAPGYDVEAVDEDGEAEGGCAPFAECDEADLEGCFEGEFGGWCVAISVGTT